jgi:phospholipid/cholesterol/gamma-HCH transport system substrate-binding protein
MAEDTDKRAAMHRQVIGVLALGAFLAVLMALAIAMRQGVFERTARVYFMADTAAGISPGIAVRLSGIRVGSVTETALQPDLKVKVTLAIEEAYYPALRSDAHAEWFKEQLQAAIIELQPGKATQALSREDPRITHSRRRTLTEVANDLRGRLAPILDDVKQLSGNVAEHRGDIAAVLVNANAATQALAASTQELRALMTHARGQVAGLGGQAQAAMGQTQAALVKVNQNLLHVDALVGTADKSLAAVNERLPALLNQTGQALDQINGVVRDVRAVSAAASAAVPSLLRSAVPLMEDGREVVGGVKASWPVRALVAPPPPALLPLDSHDAAALREAPKR